MIRKFIYFIISVLFLFFSSSVNPFIDTQFFHDKNDAIYMIHSNEDTESYNFIHLSRVEIIPKTIIRTGTPNTFTEIKPVEIEKNEYHEIKYLLSKFYFSTILSRYESRILRI